MLRENFPSCFYETWGINPDLKNTPDKPEKPIPVTTIEELKRLMSIGYRVQDVEILGNTTNKYKHYTDLFSIPSSSARNTNNVNNEKLLNTSRAPIHPVIKALYERAENNYTFSSSGEKVRVKDGKKIALAIEGGGMRGCVAAGMVTVRNCFIISGVIVYFFKQ